MKPLLKLGGAAAVLLFVFVTGIMLGDAASNSGAKAKTRTVTHTQTRTVAPQSCMDAVQDARDFANTEKRTLSAVSKYPRMVQDAARAGLNQDAALLNDVLSRMKTINSQLNSANAELQANPFKQDAAACEAAG